MLLTRRTSALAIGVALIQLACSKPSYREQQFVGHWVSSRTNTPIHLTENGIWEIRTSSGEVLQSGGWEVQGDIFLWVVKMNGSMTRDPNPIVRVQDNTFELREQDGSVTRFRRQPT